MLRLLSNLDFRCFQHIIELFQHETWRNYTQKMKHWTQQASSSSIKNQSHLSYNGVQLENVPTFTAVPVASAALLRSFYTIWHIGRISRKSLRTSEEVTFPTAFWNYFRLGLLISVREAYDKAQSFLFSRWGLLPTVKYLKSRWKCAIRRWGRCVIHEHFVLWNFSDFNFLDETAIFLLMYIYLVIKRNIFWPASTFFPSMERI